MTRLVFSPIRLTTGNAFISISLFFFSPPSDGFSCTVCIINTIRKEKSKDERTHTPRLSAAVVVDGWMDWIDSSGASTTRVKTLRAANCNWSSFADVNSDDVVREFRRRSE